MIDPRKTIINERLKEIANIIAVSSGKGGVGKSLIASTLALTLAKKGYKTGLFDLDFTSPSTHLILGVKNVTPIEEKGIIPPVIHGIKYMSIIYYSGEHAAPLRGEDISNVLIELLAITRWSKLDCLVIDMPPGISDATLDIIRLIKRIRFLVVTTPSRLAYETVRKLLNLLKDLNIPVLGVMENMKMQDSNFIRKHVEEAGVAYLGEIPFDKQLEEAIGDVNRLLETEFSRRIAEIIERNSRLLVPK